MFLQSFQRWTRLCQLFIGISTFTYFVAAFHASVPVNHRKNCESAQLLHGQQQLSTSPLGAKYFYPGRSGSGSREGGLEGIEACALVMVQGTVAHTRHKSCDGGGKVRLKTLTFSRAVVTLILKLAQHSPELMEKVLELRKGHEVSPANPAKTEEETQPSDSSMAINEAELMAEPMRQPQRRKSPRRQLELLPEPKKDSPIPKEVAIVGDPQLIPVEKEITIDTILKELAAIQQRGPKNVVMLGTRHCTFLHQQIIELLAYALVLSGNHVFTSGAGGTNAAAIRGALRADEPDLLTVILPQSLEKQPEESQTLLKQVQNVETNPQHDSLSLDMASRLCNSELLSRGEQLISFAFHNSETIISAVEEAKSMDMVATILYLD